MGSGVDYAAFSHRIVEGLAEGGLPYFVRDGDVAVTNGFVHSLRIGRHILDVVAHRLEDTSDHIGHDHLA